MWSAQEHFETLEAEIAVFQRHEPYEITPDLKSDPKAYLLRFHLLQEPQDRWAAIIGDIAHNYRSALDHLAWQLVKANGGHTGWETKFPIYQQEPDYLAWRQPRPATDPRGPRSDPFAGVDQVVIARIERSQPYTRGDEAKNHPLAVLNSISNRDKHRLPIPVIAKTERPSGFSYQGLKLDYNRLMTGERIPLGDGEIIARFLYAEPRSERVHAQITAGIAVDVMLGERGPVLACLANIEAFIRQRVIPDFRHFIN